MKSRFVSISSHDKTAIPDASCIDVNPKLFWYSSSEKSGSRDQHKSEKNLMLHKFFRSLTVIKGHCVWNGTDAEVKIEH